LIIAAFLCRLQNQTEKTGEKRWKRRTYSSINLVAIDNHIELLHVILSIQCCFLLDHTTTLSSLLPSRSEGAQSCGPAITISKCNKFSWCSKCCTRYLTAWRLHLFLLSSPFLASLGPSFYDGIHGMDNPIQLRGVYLYLGKCSRCQEVGSFPVRPKMSAVQRKVSGVIELLA